MPKSSENQPKSGESRRRGNVSNALGNTTNSDVIVLESRRGRALDKFGDSVPGSNEWDDSFLADDSQQFLDIDELYADNHGISQQSTPAAPQAMENLKNEQNGQELSPPISTTAEFRNRSLGHSHSTPIRNNRIITPSPNMTPISSSGCPTLHLITTGSRRARTGGLLSSLSARDPSTSSRSFERSSRPRERPSPKAPKRFSTRSTSFSEKKRKISVAGKSSDKSSLDSTTSRRDSSSDSSSPEPPSRKTDGKSSDKSSLDSTTSRRDSSSDSSSPEPPSRKTDGKSSDKSSLDSTTLSRRDSSSDSSSPEPPSRKTDGKSSDKSSLDSTTLSKRDSSSSSGSSSPDPPSRKTDGKSSERSPNSTTLSKRDSSSSSGSSSPDPPSRKTNGKSSRKSSTSLTSLSGRIAPASSRSFERPSRPRVRPSRNVLKPKNSISEIVSHGKKRKISVTHSASATDDDSSDSEPKKPRYDSSSEEEEPQPGPSRRMAAPRGQVQRQSNLTSGQSQGPSQNLDSLLGNDEDTGSDTDTDDGETAVMTNRRKKIPDAVLFSNDILLRGTFHLKTVLQNLHPTKKFSKHELEKLRCDFNVQIKRVLDEAGAATGHEHGGFRFRALEAALRKHGLFQGGKYAFLGDMAGFFSPKVYRKMKGLFLPDDDSHDTDPHSWDKMAKPKTNFY